MKKKRPPLLVTILTKSHARDLLALEDRRVRQMRKLYEQARKEILAQLAETSKETFSFAQRSIVEAQITEGLRVLVQRMGVQGEMALDEHLALAVDQTLAEIALFEPKMREGATQRIRSGAAIRLTGPRALLAQQYRTSLQAHGSSVLREIQGRLGVHALKNSSWREMALDIAGKTRQPGKKPGVLVDSVWKAERIVRTEMMNALDHGHRAALEEASGLVPGLAQQWDAHLDERTSDICRSLHGKVAAVGKPFATVNGRAIYGPPAHPNCRSRRIPWHPDWAEVEAELAAAG